MTPEQTPRAWEDSGADATSHADADPSSLSRRRRKLSRGPAAFGAGFLAFVAVSSLAGPALIEAAGGYSYDYIPEETELIRSFPPFTGRDGSSFSWAHPMGTDSAGRDLLARVLVGGRVSLAVGVAAAAVSLVIGVAYGAVAGYLGGKIDEALMRLVDALYAVPFMLLVIVLLALFKPSSPPGQLLLLLAALGAVSWLTLARVVRGQVLTLKHREFVLAARASGVTQLRIITRHLMPNALSPVLAYAALIVPSVMLQEAFLSFLGLGVQAPYASWGSLAAEGVQNVAVFPWQLAFPGAAMVFTLVSLNFVGDALRDALDPQAPKL